jgi:multidrug efflux system membrane fusion protein
VEAFNRDFETKLATGKLLAIDNQVDPTTGTVRIKGVFENKDNMLFPNQFVNARMLVDVLRNAVIVPAAAVQHGPEYDFVYVVKAETDDQGEPIHVVELRQVKAGPSEADDTMIETGLEPGEQVVTDGIDKLQKGALVSLGGPGGKKKGGKDESAGPAAKEGQTPQAPATEGGSPKAAENTTKAAP